MSAIAGKAILFLDTCHANRAVAARGLGPAAVDVASLVKDFSKTENGLIYWEIPRLCRGGSRSLTFPAVCAPQLAVIEKADAWRRAY